MKQTASQLKIITFEDPRLREKSQAVPLDMIKTEKFQKFLKLLVVAMLAHDGVGIAAPQIGAPWRVFAVRTKDGERVFINPVISQKSWRQEWNEEGCLSVPGIFGLVKRQKNVTLTARDENGLAVKIAAKGFFARVLQHETDHLDGVLFIDKAKDLTENKTNGVTV